MTQADPILSRLSVAPMMDWTDPNCRAFHRMLSRHTVLYTEMVTAPAIIHGDHARLLARGAEGPVVLQLGGSEPEQLADAIRRAAPYGYDQIDLNCGCPSDRVQSGTFGAVLMRDPARVAECVSAMIEASPVLVSVKCRIGVDHQVPEEVLPKFIETLRAAGLRRLTIHARKAWLAGLSPKENREVPPLDYPLVHAMKAQFPDMFLAINGGIDSLEAASEHLQIMDQVMIGRAAYQRPWDILGAADTLWGDTPPFSSPVDAARAMRPVLAAHLERGGRMHQITRHMLGLFHGRPGARGWRQVLSEASSRGTLTDYDAALAAVA